MAHIAAGPRGLSLPYSSLFSPSQRTRAHDPRPPELLWKNAASPVELGDADCPASTLRKPRSRKPPRFPRLRRIAFKAFSLNPDTAGNPRRNTLTTTEIVSRNTTQPTSIFRSWRLKSSPTKTHLKKIVVVLKTRISAASPPDQQPQSWEEYNRRYANEEIDVLNPPLPPLDLNDPSFEFYPAPRPPNEPVRQLVVNRLDLLGGKPFDPSAEGAAKAKARAALADRLIAQGKVPPSLDVRPWQQDAAADRHLHDPRTVVADVRSGRLPPETLEQHPVFRDIVKRCREIFGSALSMLSILDDDRQVFLAESGAAEAGMDGMRDVTRDISFCAHTILGGRRGMTVLDAKKDWRFGNGPLVHDLGARFYAGVPLMAPNMDGSQEAEENSCPIGTLCILDFKPREAFSSEDQKKLVYISEYARREIERWFASKIKQKVERLAATQEDWDHELKRVASSGSDGEASEDSEVLSSPGSQLRSPTSSHFSSSFRKWRSISSISTAPPLSPSLSTPSPTSPTKPRPGLFEDVHGAVKPKMRKVFDLATKLVAETLELSLVYLMAVEPYAEAEDLGRTLILSGHNIPLPVPELDPGLHLRVLRAGEGGLLYQNPSLDEAERDGFQPRLASPSAVPYASAILLAVAPEPAPHAGGFVLAGFSADPKRVFGAEDVSFMKQFAAQLAPYTSRLPLHSPPLS
ncbi:hypothetical protein PTTG_01219 [Puccinia triticina 1-1 BBBD Race 1]|uniref:GAF domain-containing protein n=1 Tax=Puccinia triticina (isolate 1-1 / race 1 (BBBD)) TaxID=630390 RepID=A0A180H0D3_PUCT1|nr:hypothetical protein PTTG_01219 [Puccinia triticina 1-1 BBBD Race 1]WAR59077.1 hypothetical protein PtB15_10B419 [Puccinia triticina]